MRQAHTQAGGAAGGREVEGTAPPGGPPGNRREALPGQLRPGPAIPPLAPPPHLPGKRGSRIVRESFGGSQAHPGKALRESFHLPAPPVSSVLSFSLLTAASTSALTRRFNSLAGCLLWHPECRSEQSARLDSLPWPLRIWGGAGKSVFYPLRATAGIHLPCLQREGGCLVQPQAGALSSKAAFQRTRLLQHLCCLLLLLTYLVSATGSRSVSQ